MNTPTVWCVGPHQYKLSVEAGVLRVEYNLFGSNGTTVLHRPGEPNAHGWKMSRTTFPCTLQGRRDAILHVDSLLRPQDKEND